jgi:hypothetical protein
LNNLEEKRNIQLRDLYNDDGREFNINLENILEGKDKIW